MDGMTLEEKEYEALAVVRDVLLLLLNCIHESTGSDSRRLRFAYDCMNRLMVEAGREL